jgi:hypothetical protein
MTRSSFSRMWKPRIPQRNGSIGCLAGNRHDLGVYCPSYLFEHSLATDACVSLVTRCGCMRRQLPCISELRRRSVPACLGHELDEDGRPFPSKVYPHNLIHTPSSNLYSNVLDMARWAIADMNRGELKGARILMASTYHVMWKPAGVFGGKPSPGTALAVRCPRDDHALVRVVLASGGHRAGATSAQRRSTSEASRRMPSGKRRPGSSSAFMPFSYAVRAIYIESCSKFVRGGVYRVVREAMSGTTSSPSRRRCVTPQDCRDNLALEAGLFVCRASRA